MENKSYENPRSEISNCFYDNFHEQNSNLHKTEDCYLQQ